MSAESLAREALRLSESGAPEWRVRSEIRKVIDALLTPPADDVREALEAVLPVPMSNTQHQVWERLVEFSQAYRAERGYPPNEAARTRFLFSAFEVRPRGTVTPTVDEWSERMDTERARQIEHGYDDAHDAQHGAAHLLNWAIDYARRGNNLAAATMVRCALRLPHGTITETETPERLAERYVSAFVGDRPDDSSTIVYRGPLLEMVANAVREARS